MRATDQFNNTDVKTIQVDVVDEEAPKLKTLGANDGYYIEVPVYGSQDLSSYIIYITILYKLISFYF